MRVAKIAYLYDRIKLYMFVLVLGLKWRETPRSYPNMFDFVFFFVLLFESDGGPQRIYIFSFLLFSVQLFLLLVAYTRFVIHA